MPTTSPVTSVDLVTSYLQLSGWVVQFEPLKGSNGSPDRLVYSKRVKGGLLRCVVGPMWTTYYRLIGDAIYEQDSTKTDDLEGIKLALSKLK